MVVVKIMKNMKKKFLRRGEVKINRTPIKNSAYRHDIENDKTKSSLNTTSYLFT